MTKPNRGLVYSLENHTPICDPAPVEIADEVSLEPTQTETRFLTEVGEAIKARRKLEEMIETTEKFNEKGGLSSVAAASLNVAVENYRQICGVSPNGLIPSLESFNDNTRERCSTIALEGLKDIYYRIRAAVQRSVRVMAEKLSTLMHNIFTSAESTLKQVQIIRGKLASGSVKPVESFEDSGLFRALAINDRIPQDLAAAIGIHRQILSTYDDYAASYTANIRSKLIPALSKQRQGDQVIVAMELAPPKSLRRIRPEDAYEFAPRDSEVVKDKNVSFWRSQIAPGQTCLLGAFPIDQKPDTVEDVMVEHEDYIGLFPMSQELPITGKMLNTLNQQAVTRVLNEVEDVAEYLHDQFLPSFRKQLRGNTLDDIESASHDGFSLSRHGELIYYNYSSMLWYSSIASDNALNSLKAALTLVKKSLV